MLVIERFDQRLPVQPSEARAPRSTDRPHVSTIIHDLSATLDPARFDWDARRKAAMAKKDMHLLRAIEADRLEWEEGDDLAGNPKIWLGAAVDEYFDGALSYERGQMSFRPGEIVKDDVAMNADRVSYEGVRDKVLDDNDDDPVIEEHKLTWMSIRYGIRDPRFAHWFWQLMAYMMAYETLRGRIRAFFINNDYGPPTPVPRVYDLLCTQQEVELNWVKLLKHLRVMRKHGRAA